MPDEEETSRLAWTKRLSRRLNKRSSSLIASLLGSRNGATSSKTINEPTTTEDELDEESMEEMKRRELIAARRASAAPNVENRVGNRHGGKEKSTSRRRSVDRIYAYKVKVSSIFNRKHLQYWSKKCLLELIFFENFARLSNFPIGYILCQHCVCCSIITISKVEPLIKKFLQSLFWSPPPPQFTSISTYVVSISKGTLTFPTLFKFQTTFKNPTAKFTYVCTSHP